MNSQPTLGKKFPQDLKHIVALSGGKDSTAMALRLAEIEPQDYIYICTPTGNEPQEMFEHWNRIGVILGKPIVPIMGGTLSGLIEKQNALPNWRQRWCTRMLKIEPYAAWLRENTPCISYVGLRADEEGRVGGDYADVHGVTPRFPMREWGWGLLEVKDYLEAKGISIPKRTDCALCFFQRLGEWYDLWAEQPESWKEGERLEALTGHTFRSPGCDSWPAAMKELAKKFEAGNIPKDRKQLDLFAEMKCRVCRI